MKIIDLDLNIAYDKLGISKPEQSPIFTGYVLQNKKEYNEHTLRPAVIILPGGGYSMTSEREATPIALEYLASGMSAFVLRYSCSPCTFPTQLVEVATAIKLVRENAKLWNIDANKIFVCGFSAGGHLTASISTLWDCDELKNLGFTDEMHKPTGSILCYPVISGIINSHQGSFINLLGSDISSENLEKLSLETRVTKSTIPSFIWHTAEDDGVPVQNSLLYANALANNGIMFELHVYPFGGHGISLANEVTAGHESQIITKCQSWIGLSKEWISSFK